MIDPLKTLRDPRVAVIRRYSAPYPENDTTFLLNLLDTLAEEVQEYRNAITWYTTCFNCSRVTEKSYATYARVETLFHEWDGNVDLMLNANQVADALYGALHGTNRDGSPREAGEKSTGDCPFCGKELETEKSSKSPDKGEQSTFRKMW